MYFTCDIAEVERQAGQNNSDISHVPTALSPGSPLQHEENRLNNKDTTYIISMLSDRLFHPYYM